MGGRADFQRFWLLIKGIANKIILLAIPLIRSQNRWKSELFPIKNGRDRREIRDIRLRDHFFRVQRLPKTFPCVWELLGVRKLRNIQANVKKSEIGPDIDTHLLERTFKALVTYAKESFKVFGRAKTAENRPKSHLRGNECFQLVLYVRIDSANLSVHHSPEEGGR